MLSQEKRRLVTSTSCASMAKKIIRAFLLHFLFSNLLASAASSSSSFFSPFIASINCGAFQSFTDERSISWISDSSIIAAGEPKFIADAESFSIPMRTLRSFAAGKRNCYSIPITDEGQVLVRASFFYGNYDGRSSPPSFGLEFDGNRWATVETAEDEVVRYEAIYEVRAGETRVCVVRTKLDEVPFVSTIEVRLLGQRMYRRYDRNKTALVLAGRMAAGAGRVVRFPDDPFDRIWTPSSSPRSLVVLDNDALVISNNVSDIPPEAALRAALTPVTGLNTINLAPPISNALPVPVYVNMYFTEVALLAGGESRSFVVYLDDSVASGPITPPFGGVLQYHLVGVTASSQTRIRLQPTVSSTLPPVVSAMEAFVVVEIGGGGDGKDCEL